MFEYGEFPECVVGLEPGSESVSRDDAGRVGVEGDVDAGGVDLRPVHPVKRIAPPS